jgi:hypothetical protein
MGFAFDDLVVVRAAERVGATAESGRSISGAVQMVQSPDLQRWRRGQICDISHAWFPSHMLRRIEGKTVGLPFAPRERVFKDGEPRVWGVPEE